MSENYRKAVTFYIDDEELHNWLKSQPEISAFVLQMLHDLKDGNLAYFAESIDAKLKQRRYDKLAKEMLKLDIDNRIRLIREMKLSPSEVVEITSGRKELEISSIVETTNNNLSPSQWDFVYGAISYGYGKAGQRKKCAVGNCGFECEHDETMRKHIIDNHSPEIQLAIKQMSKAGIT